MRIIGGKFKSKRFKVAGNIKARPTTDFAKEALFNILHHQLDFEDISVLDLFAGIGSISLEFGSRGSKDIWSVEKERKLTKFIEQMVTQLELELEMKVIQADVFRFLNTCQKKFNLIFADPPYKDEKLTTLPSLIFSKDILSEEGMLIVEHDKFTDFTGAEFHQETRKYGNVHFSFFSKD